MRSEGRGRPRLEQSRRPGNTAREEILDAAAELFTNARLRQHLDAADRRRGRRPAGLAVSPLRHQGRHPRRAAGRHRRRAAAVGRRAARREGPAAPRLHALVVGRRHPVVRQPLEPRRAVPAARAPRSTDSRSSACAARNCATATAASPPQVIAECDGPADADDLPFRLVESVINRRSDDGDCPGAAMGHRRRRAAHARLRRRLRRIADATLTGWPYTWLRDVIAAIPFAA